MKKNFLFGISLLFLTVSSLSPIYGTESATSSSSKNESSDKPIGGNTGEKGGIYVVGRGFKTAGHEMEGGFKAAGRGIKKGGQATGHAFQKTGTSIKNFFTGEKSDK